MGSRDMIFKMLSYQEVQFREERMLRLTLTRHSAAALFEMLRQISTAQHVLEVRASLKTVERRRATMTISVLTQGR